MSRELQVTITIKLPTPPEVREPPIDEISQHFVKSIEMIFDADYALKCVISVPGEREIKAMGIINKSDSSLAL